MRCCRCRRRPDARSSAAPGHAPIRHAPRPRRCHRQRHRPWDRRRRRTWRARLNSPSTTSPSSSIPKQPPADTGTETRGIPRHRHFRDHRARGRRLSRRPRAWSTRQSRWTRRSQEIARQIDRGECGRRDAAMPLQVEIHPAKTMVMADRTPDARGRPRRDAGTSATHARHWPGASAPRRLLLLLAACRPCTTGATTWSSRRRSNGPLTRTYAALGLGADAALGPRRLRRATSSARNPAPAPPARSCVRAVGAESRPSERSRRP